MIDLYIARQPIFDRSLELHGYELLYRANNDEHAEIDNLNQATAHTICTGLIEIGLENLVGKHKAFINLSRDYVLGVPDLDFPTDKVVLEISENDIDDRDVTQTLEYLSKKNYTIALDGICANSETLKLLPAASIIKIDVNKTDPSELEELVSKIKKYPVKLIAEKVEDGNQVKQLLDLGFDYLQGYFFSHPIVSKQSGLSTNQLAMVELLSKVYGPETSTEQLEELISQDVTLSYHLLKYLNSAFFSLPTTVESIRQAVIYLGRNELKTWATVISMAGHNSKPNELITTALARGRFCESVAKAIEDFHVDSFFSVGLLSVLDALMDQPIADIISKLPLSEELSSALTQHKGIMGEALNACLMLEQGDWDKIKFPEISKSALNMQYQNAIQWADDVTGNLGL